MSLGDELAERRRRESRETPVLVYSGEVSESSVREILVEHRERLAGAEKRIGRVAWIAVAALVGLGILGFLVGRYVGAVL